MTKPLADIRVLDFSKVLAGPLCTQYLADMGADVIKVEPEGVGDDTRAWPPFRAPGLGAVFLSVNRGKRSVTLDLKTESGRRAILELARTADVVVESYGNGVVERLGIDEASIRKVNPDVVYCSISGFGRNGPMKDAPGYDVILQAFCGVMSLTGEEGGSHIRSPISPIDQSTGLHALSGILAALYARKDGQPGARVEASLFDSAMGLMAYNFQSFWEKGVQPERCGSSHESLCPYQVFEASDGPIMLGVANDRLWKRFCDVAGLNDIVDDPKFATNAGRAENRVETVARVQSVVVQKPAAWWYEALAAVKVPSSPLHTLKQLLDHPHTRASGMIMSYEHPEAGTINSVAWPVRMTGVDRSVGRPAPLAGQDTDDLLREIGVTSK
jgi:crotonobetainyl-CoA:carnitine CoA-transferase CaiB-like acyl-CoA transferase